MIERGALQKRNSAFSTSFAIKDFTMFKVLVLIIALLLSGCNYVDSKNKFDNQDIWQVEKNDGQTCTVTSENLRNVFNFEGIDISTYKPEEDKDLILIAKLKSCPFDETVNTLVALQNNSQDDFGTKAKSTYLLIKIGYKVSENADLLLDLYTKRWKEVINRYKEKNYAEKIQKGMYDNRYEARELLSLIAMVVEDDYHENEFIAKVLDLEADGGLAEGLAGICGNEFKKKPEDFLRIVKTKSKKDRKDILFFIAYSMPKDELLEHISSIPKSSEVYSLAQELTKVSDKMQQ
jgi:hypothetical protein